MFLWFDGLQFTPKINLIEISVEDCSIDDKELRRILSVFRAGNSNLPKSPM